MLCVREASLRVGSDEGRGKNGVRDAYTVYASLAKRTASTKERTDTKWRFSVEFSFHVLSNLSSKILDTVVTWNFVQTATVLVLVVVTTNIYGELWTERITKD